MRTVRHLAVVIAILVTGCDIGPGIRSSRNDSPARHGPPTKEVPAQPSALRGPSGRKPRSRPSRRPHRHGSFMPERCKVRTVRGPAEPYLLRAVDFGSDGSVEWAWIDVGRMTVTDSSGRAIASIQTPAAPLEAVQWPKGRLTVAYGRSRSLPDAKFSVYTYTLRDGSLVPARLRIPTTTRPDLASMKVRDGRLYLTHFLSKYVSHTVVFDSPAASPRELLKMRMLFDVEPLGSERLAYVRLYGEERASPGGSFLKERNATKRLDTAAGGRAMTLCDLGDGLRLFAADGWDKAYRDKARPSVSVFDPRTGAKVGQYVMSSGIAVMEMECGDIDGVRGQELVLRTDRGLYVLRKGGELIQLGSYRGYSTPIQLVDVDHDSMKEIVISEISGYCEVR